ncbi:T9SS type A sorting domain-containing protein [Flavobacterium sp. NG2]|uniref:T9SS type A sorting domain-containing protein n=1 Tax=Flavobacterium sp. NG2 TaxID=3097547 RepID=UPI002A840293|nr:T9SS type A sorting domain-containing protein [Flavobacterium sp. NG2]WPR71368.1 T9SS type A sorting domain-containing protein [Flavobacterium sp. NG2]
MKKSTTIILFLFLINLGFSQVGSPLPEFRNEADFFTDSSGKYPAAPSSQRITLVYNPATGDDSPALQTAINTLTNLTVMVNGENLKGGVITIPAGTWEFNEIQLKSDVHLVFDPLAIVKPYDAVSPTNPQIPNMSIFRIGYTGVLSENVSIRASSGQFKVDLTHLDKETRITPFNVKEAKNFMVADCFVDDNGTIHAALNCSASKRNNIWAGPVKGLVKNLTIINGHGGYGVVQVRTGEKLLFKNLTSLRGGVTLRLESDDVSASGGVIPQEVAKMSEIFGYNIKCTDGNAAVMLQPWSAVNGWIDIQKIEATGCMAAVRIDKAFDKVSPFVGVGFFDSSSRITDITSAYGINAHVKQGIFPWVPCKLRTNPEILRPNPIPNMETFYLGPSVAPLLYRASTTGGAVGDGYYSINVPTENELKTNASGFDWSISLVISRDDNQVNTSNCPPALAVNTFEIDNNLKMYPNPFKSDDEFLAIDLAGISDVAIAIYDMSGKMVYANDFKGKSRVEINLPQLNLAKGTYLVNAKSGTTKVSKKIVIL